MNRVLCAMVALAVLVVPACGGPKTVKKVSDEELKARRERAQQSYSIAMGYYQQGDLEAALKNFNEALVQDSMYYEAYVAMGTVYRKQRDAASAELYYRKGMKVDPKKAKAYEGLGDLFLAMNSLDSALAVYLQGLSQDSSLVDLYNGAAEVYVKKNEMAKADSLYQLAMRRFPDDQNVQRLWADFLFKQKRCQEAVNALLPVIAKFPKVTELRQRAVDCYIELKQYDNSVAQLDTVLQLEPDNNQALLRKGAVLMLQSKTKRAVEVFETLIQRDSTKAEYYAYLGEALIQSGNTGTAEARLRKALALQPGMAQAYADLGDIRRKAADAKRGTNLAATSTTNLKAAKSLYEEAKGYYVKAQADPSYAEYAKGQVEYIDKSLSLVEKELFVR